VSAINAQFVFPVRVYWEDTDAGGVVYYANYLKFFERARTEWLRACGIEQANLQKHEDLVFAIRALSVEYLAPAKLDDVLSVTVDVMHLSAVRFSLRQAAIDHTSGATLCRADVEAVALKASSFKPKRIPTELLKRLQPA
jgi:acyl-CoA thioester hydrolase